MKDTIEEKDEKQLTYEELMKIRDIITNRYNGTFSAFEMAKDLTEAFIYLNNKQKD